MSSIELQRVPGLDEIVEDVIQIIRTHTDSTGEGWGAATAIAEMGVDSFDFVELIFEIEDRYGIDIDLNANTAGKAVATVAGVATLVQSTIKGERRPS